MSDKQVVIASIPAISRLQAPLPDGFGGTLSYSQHEVAVSGVELETPITFTIGDPGSELEAEKAIAAVVRVVSRGVMAAFAEQVDVIHGFMAQRGGYRPSRPKAPKNEL
jgi:hypothetical protein